jgi:ADP-ribose pyrophosphatase YjhB (NUDIX family)
MVPLPSSGSRRGESDAVRRQFCIRCGGRLVATRRAAGTRSVRSCPCCGWVDYNNPAPTASVLLLRRGRLLLVRRAVAPSRGAWDLPGGFIEAGETAEQAARREMREELGIKVRLERILGDVPDIYGPDAQPTLNILFIGRMQRDDAAIRATDDAASYRWFSLDALPRRLAFWNTHHAIRLLKKSRGKAGRGR